MGEDRAEAWKSRALYEEDEKLRMEQRIADALWQTGRWVVRRACANCAAEQRDYGRPCWNHDPARLEQGDKGARAALPDTEGLITMPGLMPEGDRINALDEPWPDTEGEQHG